MSKEPPSIIGFIPDDKEPLPVGTYICVIEEAEIKKNSRSIKRAWLLIHVPADQCPATQRFEGGVYLTYTNLRLEDTSWDRYKLRRFLEAIGAPLGKQIDVRDWVGRKARINVGHDLVGNAFIGTVNAI